MMSYAGIPLLSATDEMRAWCASSVPFDWLDLWDRRHANPPGLSLLDPPRPWDRGPVRLDVLRWPTGASRWACFTACVDAATLDAIRAAVYPSAGSYQAQPLVLSDGRDAVTASLWMLPARPLQQTGGPADWYLLHLVDDRYFWWYRSAAVAVTGGTTTWAQLFASMAAALGITLAVDDVAAAYLKPASSLGGLYQYLPPLLDAAARSAGLRLVRQTDGGCRLWSVAASRQKVADQLAALRPDARQAGGVFSAGG